MTRRGWSAAGWMLAALLGVFALVGGEYAWREMHPAKQVTKVEPDIWVPEVGQPVKDFGLPDGKKKVVRLSDYKGKDFLLTFFCGCNVCADMAKLIEKSYKDTGKKPEVVAVWTPGHVPEGMTGWLNRSHAPDFTYLYTPQDTDLIDKWQGHPCPKVYVVGPDQKIRYSSMSGPEASNQATMGDIAPMMGLKFKPTPVKPGDGPGAKPKPKAG